MVLENIQMMHYDRSIPSNACLRPQELFLPMAGGVPGLCSASALAPMLGSTNELVLLLLLIAREREPSACEPERESGGDPAMLAANVAGDAPAEGLLGSVGVVDVDLPCADSLRRNSTNRLPNDCGQ
jgi:hypothetical protein